MTAKNENHSDVKLVNKISSASVIGKLEKPKKTAKLFTLIGLCSGARVGTSQFGDYVEFKGNFEAITEDGKRFKSGKAFLPEVAANLLHAAVNGADGQNIEVALEIGYKPSDTPVGYEYVVKPLVKEVSDPLANLRSQLSLPGPQTDAAGDAEKK